MTLPPGFQFNQSNLQDYVDCPRRFQLRSLLRLEWPALQTVPALESERLIKLGAAFHFLIRQHQSGLPIERLSVSIQSPELHQWWDNYLTAITPPEVLSPLITSGSLNYPETSLSIPFSRFRLLAKFDLLVVQPSGQAVILDWKTSRVHPQRHWLLDRLQTRVYPYLLVKAGELFNTGQSFHPDQVEMIYWYADFPTEPELIQYSAEQFVADEQFLLDLVDRIDHRSTDDFPLTHNEQQCRFCVYRSLCDRGVIAGDLDLIDSHSDLGASFDFDLDLEQINEVEY